VSPTAQTEPTTEPETEPVSAASDVDSSESYALAVAPLLLLSHHPLVAHSRRGGRRLWKRATAVLGGCEVLLSDSGSGSGTAAATAAATAALSEVELVRYHTGIVHAAVIVYCARAVSRAYNLQCTLVRTVRKALTQMQFAASLQSYRVLIAVQLVLLMNTPLLVTRCVMLCCAMCVLQAVWTVGYICTVPGLWRGWHPASTSTGQ
jgi:hypothetical protein